MALNIASECYIYFDNLLKKTVINSTEETELVPHIELFQPTGSKKK